MDHIEGAQCPPVLVLLLPREETVEKYRAQEGAGSGRRVTRALSIHKGHWKHWVLSLALLLCHDPQFDPPALHLS